VFDPYKEVPDEVKAFDLKKKNQKKRYELRYELEQQYRDRDIKEQDIEMEKAVNRYNGEKYYEEALKGYDNITLEKTDEQIKKYEETAKVKPKIGVWDRLQHTTGEAQCPETFVELPPVSHDIPEPYGFVKTRFPQYVHGDQDSENMADYDQKNTNYQSPNQENVKFGNTVDSVYEQMVKTKAENSRRKDLGSGKTGLQFEPYHKDLRNLLKENGTTVNNNRNPDNNLSNDKSNDIKFDSMHINQNKENIQSKAMANNPVKYDSFEQDM